MDEELTSSFINAVSARPSPPDQSWICLKERQEDTESLVHFKISDKKFQLTLKLSRR